MPHRGQRSKRAVFMSKPKTAYAGGELGSACRKTKLCEFHVKGFCSKGFGCSYAHGVDELRVAPDLSRTRMCPELVRSGRCSRGLACAHAHRVEELRHLDDALPSAGALVAEWQRRHVLAPQEPQPAGRAASIAEGAGRRTMPTGKRLDLSALIDAWDDLSTEFSDSAESYSGCAESVCTSSVLMGSPTLDNVSELAGSGSDTASLDDSPSHQRLSTSQVSVMQDAPLHVITGSFLDVAAEEALAHGFRCVHAPSGFHLRALNTFIEVEEPRITGAIRRCRSVQGRLMA